MAPAIGGPTSWKSTRRCHGAESGVCCKDAVAWYKAGSTITSHSTKTFCIFPSRGHAQDRIVSRSYKRAPFENWRASVRSRLPSFARRGLRDIHVREILQNIIDVGPEFCLRLGAVPAIRNRPGASQIFRIF